MIKYMNGDAVKALQNKDIDYLMHCCNAQGVMGSGIALQIRNAFPSTYQRYKAFCNLCPNLNMLGSIVIEDNVINIIGQNQFGTHRRQVNYGAIAKAFYNIITHVVINNTGGYQEPKPIIIGMPYNMCCDRAGGDWEVIKELLELFPSNFEIHVYKLGE